MKKKFLTFILAICFIIPCMFMLSACDFTSANIEFKVENGYIQYYDGEYWNNLIAVEDLKGEDGDVWTISTDGYWYKNGVKTNNKATGSIGAKGNGIKSIAPSTDSAKTNETQTTYVITLDDNSTYEFVVKNGTNGSNGKDGKDADVWTIGTDGYWYKNGVKTDSKAIGEDGDEYTIGADGYWYLNGEKTTNKATGSIGAKGNGIKSIAPSTDSAKTNETQTTYVITFDDNSTYEFVVKNGTNGSNGKDGKDADVWTIGTDGYWYKNGVKTNNKAIGEDATYSTYTITYDYGSAKDCFDNAVDTQKIKSTEWITEMPIIKKDYRDSFLGWFISNTNRKFDLYDFVGGDITLEARFDVEIVNMAGFYSYNGKFIYDWDYLTENYKSNFNGNELSNGNFGYGQLVLSNTITSIADSAFASSHLSKVILPQTITSIGISAFYNCQQLTSIIIPEGITEIKATTFSGCENLKEVLLSSTVKSLGECAFLSCEKLESIDLMNVTNIDEGCFQNCSSLLNIKMNKVTSIGEESFYACRQLQSIDFSDDLTFVGQRSFYGCSSLQIHCCDKGYYLGDNTNQHLILMKIADKNIEQFIINDECKIVFDEAFKECNNLKDITFPSGLLQIGAYAFDGCYNLVEINLPNTVQTIGMYAFKSCTGLKNIIALPKSLLVIDYAAFYGCDNIETIVINNSLTQIGKHALNCKKLNSIYYFGTNTGWEGISILDGNIGIENSTIYYYIENEIDVPSDGGNYWHYDTDGITPIAW